MTNPRHPVVLLDLDHTLLDSDASEGMAFEQALASVGVRDASAHLPEYLEINGSLWAAVERGELAPDDVREERFRRLVRVRRLDADPSELSDEYSAGLVRNGDLYPGALEVLEELSGLARLALVTNGISDIQRARIERLGIERFFDAIAVSAEIGSAKPHRGIFDAVFTALGTRSDGALMVGDNLASDIRGGAAYGLATCWYNPRGRSAPGDVAITYEIASLDALPDVVTG